MAEHIDSDRLHADLRYRFNYLSKFLNFTADDMAMLNTFAPIVLPVIPVLVDTVYRKLFSFDVTKQYFLIRNEGFEGFLPRKTYGVAIDSAQMELRKDMLSMYVKRILTQSDWNDSFLQFLSHIGQIHTNQGGSTTIKVDYMHVNALFGFLEHLLIDILCNTDTFDEKLKRRILMALNKFFWIQNDFFTMHYLTPSKDKPVPSQTPPASRTSKCCWI